MLRLSHGGDGRHNPHAGRQKGNNGVMQTPSRPPLWLWIALPAVTMSVGWGLRGFIGGGPLGAMIPGAMVAMVLALLMDLDGDDAALMALLGAIGVGFGGQMTYGQTVSLAKVPETFWWALLGFWVKGAVWGFLGGAVMGLAAAPKRSRGGRRFVAAGLALMTLGTWAGWKLINQPKLVYFSNRLDRPREEIWAGLALGALAWLLWMGRKGAAGVLWRWAVWGLIAGGTGFAAGAWVQVAGGRLETGLAVDWWKMMEFLFGLLLGAGFGAAAWSSAPPGSGPGADGNRRPAVQDRPAVSAAAGWSPRVSLAAAALLIAACVGMEYYLPGRFNYTIAGVLVVALVWNRPAWQWQAAVTVTCFAFALDLAESRPAWGAWGVAGAAAASAAVALAVARMKRLWGMFTLLTALAVAVSFLKTYLPAERPYGPSVLTQALFLVMAAAAVLMARQAARRRFAG
jgi:hypothetical protein